MSKNLSPCVIIFGKIKKRKSWVGYGDKISAKNKLILGHDRDRNKSNGSQDPSYQQ